jgi:polyphosphate kinase
VLGQRDILLHHPYESFNAVIDLLREAVQDPDVLAIKQTLYRAGKDTPLVDLLVEAARNGKDVTVVIELRARFDEEANIRFATRLQEAGVQVVYGVVGFKTHAKMMLIVRRENGHLRRYSHLSTGNYHQANSRLYTDIGLMTADPEIGEDLHKVFQQLSGLGPMISLKRLLHSPFTLYNSVIAKIERESDARAQRAPCAHRRQAQCTQRSACDRSALRRCASGRGDRPDRARRVHAAPGTCPVSPNAFACAPSLGVSSNTVACIGSPTTASGNLLRQRGLDGTQPDAPHRGRLSHLDPQLAKRVYDETLANYLADNTQAWLLDSDGHYERATPGA